MTEAPGKRAVKEEQVTYGTFEDVPPLADGGELRLHYVSCVSRLPSSVHNTAADFLARFFAVLFLFWGAVMVARSSPRNDGAMHDILPDL